MTFLSVLPIASCCCITPISSDFTIDSNEFLLLFRVDRRLEEFSLMSIRLIPSLSSPTSSVRTPIVVMVAKCLGGSPDVGLRMGAVVEDCAAPAVSVVADILGTWEIDHLVLELGRNHWALQCVGQLVASSHFMRE